MATPAYLSITGEQQGLITSDSLAMDLLDEKQQQGHESEILVQSFNHKMTVNPGSRTGLRTHQPIKIIKELDKSSPLLAQAFTSGERLLKCEMRLYRTNAQGQQEHYYTIKLTDALICDIEISMNDCRHSFEGQSATPDEILEISYRTIEWIHEKAGTFGSDSWDN